MNEGHLYSPQKPAKQLVRNSLALTRNELLVVIAAIALLIWILPGMLGGHDHRGHREIVDISRLRQIGIAMFEYAVDNKDVFPNHPRDATGIFDDPSTIKQVYLNPYQNEGAMLDRGDFEGPAVRFGGYVFVNLGLGLDDIETPTEVILAYTAKISSKQATRSVLFADGHTEKWEEKELRNALPDEVDVDALDGP